MSDLIHIRVGKQLKEKMEELIDKGIFSNQAEIAREGLRTVLFKYSAELSEKEQVIKVKGGRNK